MDVVWWVALCVGGTALPMSLDLLRIFLPRSLQTSRLVAGWQKPILLAMVGLLSASGYFLFWDSVLSYSHSRLSAAGISHGIAATIMWFNTVWNYVLCAAIDPGVLPKPDSALGVGGEDGRRWPANSRYCSVCEARVMHLDHHCPFTGGCVGGNNFRFFFLFCLHSSLGMCYACYLSYFPFRDCVFFQCSIPAIGLYRSPPPDDEACRRMAARSLVLLPCGVLFGALGSLASFHTMLLVNGLTTAQYARRLKARGMRSFFDLVLRRGEPQTDKWLLLWGRKAAPISHVLRILVIPSLPEHLKLSPEVASSRKWVIALVVMLFLGYLLPYAASLLWLISVHVTNMFMLGDK